VENEYWAKHQHVPVIKPESVLYHNLFPSSIASVCGISSFDIYDILSDDAENSLPNNVAQTIPGQSYRAACLMTAATLHLNLLPEARKYGAQIDPSLNDYHADPMHISSSFGRPVITNWQRQQEETQWMYVDHPIMACNIFSIVPHTVGV